MSRQLVTCPVCKADQHTRKGLICNHTGDGGLRCSGSHESISAAAPTPLKVRDLATFIPVISIREALIAMSYTEVRPGEWVKPVAFQAFIYVERKGEWINWFKSATGDLSKWKTKQFQSNVGYYGSYLQQLKSFECWTRTDLYTHHDSGVEESHFELGAIDL